MNRTAAGAPRGGGRAGGRARVGALLCCGLLIGCTPSPPAQPARATGWMERLALGHWAALLGSASAMGMLLDLGADANAATDGRGITPLHVAARGGHADVVRLLLEWGARVDAPTAEGQTPLMFAVAARREPVVRLLLDHGANVRATDRAGATPLHWAAQECAEAVARWWLDQGAPVDARDTRGETPRDWATRAGCAGMVRVLETGRATREGLTGSRSRGGAPPRDAGTDEEVRDAPTESE